MKKRTKLADRKLPDYSRGEELFNMISHIVGGGLGIVVLVMCVVKTALNRDFVGVGASVVYGLSMICLYTMSSLYHGLSGNISKRVFQVIDHCTIYFLIAGTYTPIILCSIIEASPLIGWLMFGFQWGLFALSVTLTAIDIKKYEIFSMICYIGMGWMIAFVFGLAIEVLTLAGAMLLLAGGIVYTIGAVLYAVGKKRKYMHNVFHVFCLVGSLLQFLSIILYVI